MVNCIRRIGKEITDWTTNARHDFDSLVTIFTEELNRLDPRDFIPDAQFDFVTTRQAFRAWARLAQPEAIVHENYCGGVPDDEYQVLVEKAATMVKLLDMYAGEGSSAKIRSFKFIADSDLRSIIERDYKELTLTLVPDAAWKSAVVLAGSILEAILYDLLTSESTRKTQASASPKAPKSDLDKGDWMLGNLIAVTADIGAIAQNRAKTIDQSLRDYRNFIHPKAEIRAGHQCTEAEAMMAKGALDAVCNDLESATP